MNNRGLQFEPWGTCTVTPFTKVGVGFRSLCSSWEVTIYKFKRLNVKTMCIYFSEKLLMVSAFYGTFLTKKMISIQAVQVIDLIFAIDFQFEHAHWLKIREIWRLIKLCWYIEKLKTLFNFSIDRWFLTQLNFAN